ncbi:peptidase [Marivirga tractuosa]|uniref:Abortive infection protein n=1 Tax=Marivirga tractuosa (strain ATCC 23168 / DSM 4126 / NBRC 15989 / NCIMB 1408 / VKM B-1430 / H-43) TaxID=643867 RepID=E4TUZ0_MARTH|nr:CPBP family intramembrane glutamic endopeptidase [Marivirga tractuosa]ADR21095.1 Abortive infection protein [Marivirga tractuosa DSM 4126]BDD14450.1 peptidase [Marivirga tractuosa]
MKNLNNKGWQFVGLTILLSAIPYFFIISERNVDSSWTLLLMWMPALAGIIMRLVTREGLFKGLNWNPLRDWKLVLLAIFLPFTIEIISLLAILSLNAAELKGGFLLIEDGNITIRGTALLLGADFQPWFVFIPNYLLSYTVGVLFYSLMFAFGEEYGWRGYLQKQWAPNNKKLVGFIAIGTIWGLWHLPGILLGHNFPDYPILGGLILMPITCIGFSLVFGTTFNKNYVIWVPAILHGAVNISSEITSIALVENSIMNTLYDTIWLGLWVLTAIGFYWKYMKSRQQSLAKGKANAL